MMNRQQTALDVDFDRPRVLPGVWVCSPDGVVSVQRIGPEVNSSVLHQGGGRVFVDETEGAKSKAGLGWILLAEHATAEEMAPLNEYLRALDAGEHPGPVPAEALPAVVLERRAKHSATEAKRRGLVAAEAATHRAKAKKVEVTL